MQAARLTETFLRRAAAPFEGRARIIGHFGFWLVALAFFTVYFGQRQSSYGESLIFVSLLFPITIATTYFLIYWLIPRYLLTRRYAYFTLYFSYTLVFSVYLELMLVMVMYITVSDFREMFIRPSVVEILNVLAGMYLVVFAGAALHLLGRWYSVKASNLELDRRRLEAELKLREAELKLLKSQIHPHFLFNTLNNLYGLTLERSDAAPDVVLKISSMLDYMLYRGSQALVPLTEEIEYVRNYLALEGLRYGDRVRVNMRVDGAIEGKALSPLLLIPFVENAFKHGAGNSRANAEIDIGLRVIGDSMRFVVENTTNHAAQPIGRSPAEGIGLMNVRRRLDLQYGDRHELQIDEVADRFLIELTLALDESPDDALPDR